MKVENKAIPSEKGQTILNALKVAVDNALERKRKLGQYAVVWDGHKPVLNGHDAPVNHLD